MNTSLTVANTCPCLNSSSCRHTPFIWWWNEIMRRTCIINFLLFLQREAVHPLRSHRFCLTWRRFFKKGTQSVATAKRMSKQGDESEQWWEFTEQIKHCTRSINLKAAVPVRRVPRADLHSAAVQGEFTLNCFHFTILKRFLLHITHWGSGHKEKEA